MKKSMFLKMLVVSLLSSLVLITSCKKEDAQPGNQTNNNPPPPPPPPPETGEPPFSGTWTGTIRVDDINPNFCYFSGDPISVKQEWLVNKDSSLSIIETLLDSGSTTPGKTTWTGRLYYQDSLSLTMSRNINCGGTYKIMKTQLNAKIAKAQDNKYVITTWVDYPMCPPDCLFGFNYSLKKED